MLDNAQVGQEIIVKYTAAYSGSPRYYLSKITKVTKTRVEVNVGSSFTKTFTKDGKVYPRETGYGRSYYSLLPVDDTTRQLALRQELIAKILRMSDQNSRILGEIKETDVSCFYSDQLINLMAATKEVNAALITIALIKGGSDV